jgi:hypothetical protein
MDQEEIMIPLHIARAVVRIWNAGGYAGGNAHIPLHLITDPGDTLVFIETASTYAAIQVSFDDPDLEEEGLDILIPATEIMKYVSTDGKHDVRFSEFSVDDPHWKDIDSALAAANAVSPADVGISIPNPIGLNIGRLNLIAEALQHIYTKFENVVRIAVGENPLGVVTFYVPIEDAAVETRVFLMPCAI